MLLKFYESNETMIHNSNSRNNSNNFFFLGINGQNADVGKHLINELFCTYVLGQT